VDARTVTFRDGSSMPNWCDNNIEISGSEEDVKAFKVFARGATQCYNSFNRLNTDDWGGYNDIKAAAIFSIAPASGSISDFSFHALYPVPEEIRMLPYSEGAAKKVCEIIKKEYPGCGYDWEVANWGVKWGENSVSIDNEYPGYIRYSFITPWSPPISLLEKIAADWSMLKFKLNYSEAGMGFQGKVIFEEGKLTFNVEEDFCYYEPDSEGFCRDEY